MSQTFRENNWENVKIFFFSKDTNRVLICIILRINFNITGRCVSRKWNFTAKSQIGLGASELEIYPDRQIKRDCKGLQVLPAKKRIKFECLEPIVLLPKDPTKPLKTKKSINKKKVLTSNNRIILNCPSYNHNSIMK